MNLVGSLIRAQVIKTAVSGKVIMARVATKESWISDVPIPVHLPVLYNLAQPQTRCSQGRMTGILGVRAGHSQYLSS